jgi:hypothetical protein
MVVQAKAERVPRLAPILSGVEGTMDLPLPRDEEGEVVWESSSILDVGKGPGDGGDDLDSTRRELMIDLADAVEGKSRSRGDVEQHENTDRAELLGGLASFRSLGPSSSRSFTGLSPAIDGIQHGLASHRSSRPSTNRSGARFGSPMTPSQLRQELLGDNWDEVRSMTRPRTGSSAVSSAPSTHREMRDLVGELTSRLSSAASSPNKVDHGFDLILDEIAREINDLSMLLKGGGDAEHAPEEVGVRGLARRRMTSRELKS